MADIVKCGCCRVIETKEGRDKGTFISKIPKAGSDPKNLQTNSGSLEFGNPCFNGDISPYNASLYSQVDKARGMPQRIIYRHASLIRIPLSHVGF